MNAFEDARSVEARGLVRILPLLEYRYERYVITDKGPLAPVLQKMVGDIIVNRQQGDMRSIELKTEEYSSKNLFLETWSNRNLDSRQQHADRGSTPGWFLTQRADLLLYQFLENDHLYVFDFFKLKQWAFVNRRLFDFKEVPQSKRVQKNDTWGRLVPLAILKREVGYHLIFPGDYLPSEAAE